MSFVQAAFPAFFLAVFVLYYLAASSLRLQNLVILLASYVFYGWWNWRLLGLFLLSTAIAFLCGVGAGDPDRRRARQSVVVACVLLLGILGLFKYFNFFAASAGEVLALFGVVADPVAIKLALPIGISFYTFQAIAYVVDVYRAEVPPERDLIRFAAFKAFFPQLVAGPIERAGHLLEQFKRPRPLNAEMMSEGVWLAVYGYFMKVVVADTAAAYANIGFAPNQPLGWWTVFGVYAFGLQIYADFFGYSLIAKGAARLLGFDLMWNFNFPYWSRSIGEFWRRWHISLSLWLRDYLYIPLGGNRGGRVRTIGNLMITMTLGGLWHGANWTFVAWGVLHGAALSIERLFRSPRRAALPGARGRIVAFAGWAATMIVVFAGWFLFRAQDLGQMSSMIEALGNMEWLPGHADALQTLAILTVAVALTERWQIAANDRWIVLRAPKWATALGMSGMAVVALVLITHVKTAFIYFQF